MSRHMVKGVVAIFVVLFIAAVPSRADQTRTLTNLKGEAVMVPGIVPDRGALESFGALVVTVETPIHNGGLIVALYSASGTERPEDADYVELYDLAGDLLEIAWFDETGKVNVAHDRNLADPKAKGPARILVMGADHRFIILRH